MTGLIANTNAPKPQKFPLAQAACGYALANKGHNTRTPDVRYTEMSPTRFKDIGATVKTITTLVLLRIRMCPIVSALCAPISSRHKQAGFNA